MFKKNSRYLGGILLVAGTCIGAGMIGVPVKTAAAGLGPTLISFGIVWIAMTISALLFVEASLCFPGETNFISMAQATLGNIGKNIAWIVTLFYMYSIMAAYTSGGVTMIIELLPMNVYLALFIYLFPFALVLYLGAKWVDLVNRFLTIGLIISFISLCVSIIFGAKSLQPTTNLSVSCYGESLRTLIFSLPLLVTTFGYHVIIPSLKSYLQEQVPAIKKTIFIGSAIPFVVYVIWQIVVLLLIPVFGNEGLQSMAVANKNPGDSIASYLLKYNQNKSVLCFLVSFSFFALTSSLIGVAWALGDFFADGFNIVKNHKGKIALGLLTFVPPILYALIFPQGFLKALELCGAFSAILMIMYPALMAYRLRIQKHTDPAAIKYRVPINKMAIKTIIVFSGIVVLLVLFN